MLCEEEEELYDSHEEAGSRMFFYLDQISGPGNVAICTDDWHRLFSLCTGM